MDRRTLLTAITIVIGSSVTGCLDNSAPMGDSNDSESNNDQPIAGTKTDERSSGSPKTDEHSAIYETHFEILDDSSDDKEESASVAFDDGTVIVTGTIMGNNSCYTARLNQTEIGDERLTVDIESYEDAAEDVGCTTVIISIEYKATIEIRGDLPESVRVNHNGDHVTTEKLS